MREEPYAIDQWRDDAASGRLVETLACGTAAVVTPVGTVRDRDATFTIGTGGPGQIATRMRSKLVGIQNGTENDPHGWMMKLD